MTEEEKDGQSERVEQKQCVWDGDASLLPITAQSQSFSVVVLDQWNS